MKLTPNTNILIVGLGVIGGGYAKALTRRGYHIRCITKNEKDIEYAKFDPIPFAEIEKTIKLAKNGAGEFTYIFNTLEKLCKFMKIKATLGIETRKAYKQKDLKALKQVVKKLTKAIKALDKFIPVFKNQWFICVKKRKN